MAKQRRSSNVVKIKTSNAKSKGAIATQLNHTHRRTDTQTTIETSFEHNVATKHQKTR